MEIPQQWPPSVMSPEQQELIACLNRKVAFKLFVKLFPVRPDHKAGGKRCELYSHHCCPCTPPWAPGTPSGGAELQSCYSIWEEKHKGITGTKRGIGAVLHAFSLVATSFWEQGGGIPSACGDSGTQRASIRPVLGNQWYSPGTVLCSTVLIMGSHKPEQISAGV